MNRVREGVGIMLPRRVIQPEENWRLRFSANHSKGLQYGPLIFVSGQADLDSEANLANPGDLAKQSVRSVDYVKTLLVRMTVRGLCGMKNEDLLCSATNRWRLWASG